jgi:hypothetical protein
MRNGTRRNQMLATCGYLDALPMYLSREISGRNLVHMLRNASLLVVLLVTRGGNFTISLQRNLLSLSELNLMNATFLD